ncbi:MULTISPECIES: DUF7159 family protein [Mycobacterium avium complex (MAC)]|uniref:DUF7159 domain-containing protein n=5 Tax=Mycobacterium avium complex (MAC) TaxID=120793 RepID=A0A0H2ZR69_MYCA1|nr:conserved hypothetical protein [Mycobacterium avium 104]ETZ49468.1 hypothetical protein L837_0224 [Mycobacterium avium MAV_061107_1842]KBR62199.1 hypothetical protein X425_02752 [Mycobacterium avium XTB13-223]BAN33311.1 hypothetical protein MAH_4237 [Mycobacterium avium subsp. hominissuis TH135]
MDTVLGVSMAPTAVRMVLVEGENGDGATVDEDNFDVATSEDAATVTASDQVLSAILGTRQGAAEGGYQLASTGVTFTDPVEAAALRDKLAAHKVENVMLVSAFLAAAALAQAVGHRTNYAHTALLYIEPDTATLAVVDSADGSIADVRRQPLPEDDEAAVAELASMVSNAENLETRPDAVFVVGSGIDIPLIKPALEAATTLPLTAPEEPDTALARGAALASAHAPLFASSTAALAYAQDPGTGAINPLAVAPGYFETPADAGADGLAYSAVPDDPDEFFTGTQAAATELVDADYADRSSFKLVGSAVAAIFVIGVVALVVSLAIAIRPTANVRPSPNQNVVVAPTRPAPAAPAPAPAPEAPAPAPAAAPQAPAPAPEAPAPAPAAPAPAPVQVAPVPVPEAPAPAPAAPPPPPPAVAPIPVPIPLPIPGLGGPGFGGPPGHGGGDGGGHGGGGFPGFPGGGGHGGGGFPGFGGGHGGFGHH